jgi:hypothetical protein
MCSQGPSDIAQELTVFAPELVEARGSLIQAVLLALVCSERNHSGAKLSTEKLWEILCGFIEQERFMLGDESALSLANGTDHVVGEICQVLVQKEQKKTDIEDRPNTSGVDTFGARQGVAGCGNRLRSGAMLLSSPFTMPQPDGQQDNSLDDFFEMLGLHGLGAGLKCASGCLDGFEQMLAHL